MARVSLTLPAVLDNTAEQFATRGALSFCGQRLNYEEVVHRSNSMARALVERGVCKGERVGLYMHKGLNSVIAIYGVMKAGAIYVPLDISAPLARINSIILDCNIRYLITEDIGPNRIECLTANPSPLEFFFGLPQDIELPVRGMAWEEIYTFPGHSPSEVKLNEHDYSYVLYTSGSTGKPKGIVHTHKSALSFVNWATRTYALNCQDRLSSHAPFHFDLSIFDLFASAAVGSETVIIPEKVAKFPADLASLLSGEHISVWYSVPFALIQLLERGALHTQNFTDLRWVLFAGEVFPNKHLRRLMQCLPQARFSNLYGPTETNVCTYYLVDSLPDAVVEPIPIGQPCEGVELLLVDSADQPVAPGRAGELLVSAPSVMQGYLGQPDLTQRVFLYHQPLSTEARLFYRTGDMAVQEGKNYKLLGRKDRQVKIRGYRVELDEIESALLSCDVVNEAAIYTLPGEQENTCIEGAVIPKPNEIVTSTQLMRFLSTKLPSYALPSRITINEEFPRTSTGKIDRQRLQSQALAERTPPSS